MGHGCTLAGSLPQAKRANRMETSAFEKLVGLAGKLDQVTKGWTILKANPPINSSLSACPILAFSEAGIRGLCNRYRITPDDLEACIVALLSENLKQSREEWNKQDLEQVMRPTPELLATIRRAVTPTRPRRKAAPKPKQASAAKKSKAGEGQNNG